jgi:hypothetical protein
MGERYLKTKFCEDDVKCKVKILAILYFSWYYCVSKLRIIGWIGHAAYMGDNKTCLYEFLVGKSERMRSFDWCCGNVTKNRIV